MVVEGDKEWRIATRIATVKISSRVDGLRGHLNLAHLRRKAKLDVLASIVVVVGHVA